MPGICGRCRLRGGRGWRRSRPPVRRPPSPPPARAVVGDVLFAAEGDRERLLAERGQLPLLVRHAERVEVAADDALRAVGAAVGVEPHHEALGRLVHDDDLDRGGRAVAHADLAAGALRGVEGELAAQALGRRPAARTGSSSVTGRLNSDREISPSIAPILMSSRQSLGLQASDQRRRRPPEPSAPAVRYLRTTSRNSCAEREQDADPPPQADGLVDAQAAEQRLQPGGDEQQRRRSSARIRSGCAMPPR